MSKFDVEEVSGLADSMIMLCDDYMGKHGESRDFHYVVADVYTAITMFLAASISAIETTGTPRLKHELLDEMVGKVKSSWAKMDGEKE